MGVGHEEIKRQYRLAKQALAIHCGLRDRYRRRSMLASLTMTVCSTIFCATTFSGDSLYVQLGFTPTTARNVMGIASVLAFASSLCLLVLDWGGRAEKHDAASSLWGAATKRFRDTQQDEGGWADGIKEELSSLYWHTSDAVCPIPDRQFVARKAAYLRKVELSKLSSRYPSCPQWLMRARMLLHDVRGFIRSKPPRKEAGPDGDKNNENSSSGSVPSS